MSTTCRARLTVLAIGAAGLLSGCMVAGSGAGDICEQAAAHYADCLGEPAVPSSGCDEAMASRIVGTACEDLLAAKDGGWSDYDHWYCSFAPSSDGCAGQIRVTVEVAIDWDEEGAPTSFGPARCVLVRATGANDSELATAVTNESGEAMLQLPQGQATFTLYSAEEIGAETQLTFLPEEGSGGSSEPGIGPPARQTHEVGGYETVSFQRVSFDAGMCGACPIERMGIRFLDSAGQDMRPGCDETMMTYPGSPTSLPNWSVTLNEHVAYGAWQTPRFATDVDCDIQARACWTDLCLVSGVEYTAVVEWRVVDYTQYYEDPPENWREVTSFDIRTELTSGRHESTEAQMIPHPEADACIAWMEGQS